MRKTKRTRQIAELIQTVVAQLLKKEVSDPRLTPVVITGVDLAPDFRNAVIFFTLSNATLQSIHSVEKAFQKATGFFRYQLSQLTELRYTPQLKFQYDQSIAHAERIAYLLSDA